MTLVPQEPKPRMAVLVSDLHCGSTYGLLPPGFVTGEGNEVKGNAIQEWLWRSWEDVWYRVREHVAADPYIVIVNGDAMEGVHHGTKEVISPDEGDHLEAAYEVLSALPASPMYIIEGTECHTRNMEHALAKRLKARPNPNTGRAAWDRLPITIAGTPCVFFHHISTTSRAWLRSSALGIFLANEQMHALESRDTVPRVIGCGHRHVFGSYEGPNGVCVVTPAWQGITRFGRKVVPSARVRPGIVVLDWRGRPDGSSPAVHLFEAVSQPVPSEVV